MRDALLRRFFLLALIVSICGWTLGGDAEPSGERGVSDVDPDARRPGVSLTIARDRAKWMHNIYAATLEVMHEHYFEKNKAVLPARAMEDIFAEMSRQSNMEARWISVNTKPMSVRHEPKSDFEKQAAKALAAGQEEFEQIENGRYYRAAPIPLSADCVSCHTGFFSAAPKSPRVAGLVISVPITETSSSGNNGRPKQKPLVQLPKTVSAPQDNPTTTEKIALGRQLFFDPRLSGDNRMSCATCHLPEKAFGDGVALSKGDGDKLLSRNTPTLLNVGFLESFNWDGRAKSLEEQALGPIQSPEEMNQDLAELERELNAVPGYVEQFQKVFKSSVTRDGIAKLLAAFQRTLVTKPSPFDRYLAGDKAALSAEAKKGLELFEGSAGCVRCHQGPLLSDGQLYRLGVSFKDEGLAAVTGKKEDKGKFRTPSLRSIAQTGPYMHDGSKKTLAEVVEFYYRGVPTTTPDGLPLDVQPLLGQSYSEISSLVAFLESLTGEAPKIEPPALP